MLVRNALTLTREASVGVVVVVVVSDEFGAEEGWEEEGGGEEAARIALMLRMHRDVWYVIVVSGAAIVPVVVAGIWPEMKRRRGVGVEFVGVGVVVGRRIAWD